MANSVRIAHASLVDAAELAANIRPEDADEIMAATGDCPTLVLMDALNQSTEAWAVRVNGALLAMYGVASDGCGIGSIWMVASKLADRKPKTLWRTARSLFPRLLERWGVLTNYVDCRHEKSFRFIHRLGASFEDPRPFGPEGRPFRRFVFTRREAHV